MLYSGQRAKADAYIANKAEAYTANKVEAYLEVPLGLFISLCGILGLRLQGSSLCPVQVSPQVFLLPPTFLGERGHAYTTIDSSGIRRNASRECAGECRSQEEHWELWGGGGCRVVVGA